MKNFSVSTICAISFLSVAPIVEAFDNTYQCIAAAETTVGYAPGSSRIEAETGKVKKPHTVRLWDVVGDIPVLEAQQMVPLVKLADTRDVIWFAEKASAGIIIWTLFDKDNIRPVTLVSTKSYSFLGAVSFTAFYTCK